MSSYNMNHKHRGSALIFNHEVFQKGLRERKGTKIDGEELSKALKNLNFDVSVYDDCEKEDFLKHINEAARQDHTDNDCILIAIMSHGGADYIDAKDEQINLDIIWNAFTPDQCRTLAGKPKIFIIQACRGPEPGSGFKKDGKTEMSAHIDYIKAFCTVPDHLGYRDSKSGSYFIQALVKELNKNGKTADILTILTTTNAQVAQFEKDDAKQMPSFYSTLTGTLCFPDKHHLKDEQFWETMAIIQFEENLKEWARRTKREHLLPELLSLETLKMFDVQKKNLCASIDSLKGTVKEMEEYLQQQSNPIQSNPTDSDAVE